MTLEKKIIMLYGILKEKLSEFEQVYPGEKKPGEALELINNYLNNKEIDLKTIAIAANTIHDIVKKINKDNKEIYTIIFSISKYIDGVFAYIQNACKISRENIDIAAASILSLV